MDHDLHHVDQQGQLLLLLLMLNQQHQQKVLLWLLQILQLFLIWMAGLHLPVTLTSPWLQSHALTACVLSLWTAYVPAATTVISGPLPFLTQDAISMSRIMLFVACLLAWEPIESVSSTKPCNQSLQGLHGSSSKVTAWICRWLCCLCLLHAELAGHRTAAQWSCKGPL